MINLKFSWSQRITSFLNSLIEKGMCGEQFFSHI